MSSVFDVILDRDGILNVDAGYTYRLMDCVLTKRAAKALGLLRDVGARFSIATGQSGIAKGLYTEADMEAFNVTLQAKLIFGGIAFAAVAFCPHHPAVSDCECRKPKLGMLRQIEDKIGPIDWAKAWGIGDKPSDAEMILAQGGRSVLVRSGQHNNTTGKSYWDEQDPALKDLLSNPRNFVAGSLEEAAQLIVKEIKE